MGRQKKFLIAVLYIFGLLIPISRQPTDIPIDWCLVFILSVLYFAVCIISLFTEKFWNENQDMHILLIGAFTAFIFSLSLDHDSNVIALISIAVRLEVLLLAIGVPLVFNAAIIKKNPGKHLEAIRLLKRFVYLSLFVIVLLLFQLSIFDEDFTRSRIFLGIISISIFLFMYSIFYFIHIIIKSIDIFLKDVGELKQKQKQKLKDSIRKGDEESIKKHCNNLDGKDIADVMREMIEKEIDKAGDALLGGMHHLIELKCAYLKTHQDTSTLIELLWEKVKNMEYDNAKEIKSLLRKEFPKIIKHAEVKV